MSQTSVAVTAFTIAVAATIWGIPSASDAGSEDASSCKSLVTDNLAGLTDAPTQVTGAKLVEAIGDVPAYCEASGVVAPTVGFILRLPVQKWNGKFFERGCGGYCGSTFPTSVDGGLLRRGYAYLMFDGGHTGSGDLRSALWAYNNLQAQFDFGIRAPHVAALAGKAITERYYSRRPQESYFQGCSSGGQQALSEAQRFPWDFDGIIVGAPSPTFSGPMMYYLWAGKALAGIVSRADLQFVHEKVLAKCDMYDGLKDGIINDPRSCKFDPGELQCNVGQTTGCLTRVQVEAIRKVYAGPTTSSGEKIYTGGPMPGSELNWISDGRSPYASDSGIAPWSIEYFRYVGFMPAAGPQWKPEDFDFDRDYKRLRMAESLFGAADNPDLRKFRAAGGKMIMYQGWQDQSDIPSDAIDYYETVERTMGGRTETESFFRLFMVPGMNHCFGGPGAFAIDYLTYMEAWVEKGHAPDVMMSAHVTNYNPGDWRLDYFPLDPSKIGFRRPVYPYPIQSKYKGSGDPADPANFHPAR